MDRSKVGVVDFARVCEPRDIDIIVTDSANEDLRRICREHEIRLEEASMSRNVNIERVPRLTKIEALEETVAMAGTTKGSAFGQRCLSSAGVEHHGLWHSAPQRCGHRQAGPFEPSSLAKSTNQRQTLDQFSMTLNPRRGFFTTLRKCARSRFFAAPPPLPPLFVSFAENTTNRNKQLHGGVPGRMPCSPFSSVMKRFRRLS